MSDAAIAGRGYGQSREFSLLERIAIGRRLKPAEQVLRRIIAARSQPAVLEVGCGYAAANLRRFRRLLPRATYVGVDRRVDCGAVEGVELVQADLEHWTPPRTFDAVLSLAVAEHVLRPDRHLGLIRDCLAPGGQAVLTTPTPASHAVLGLLAAVGVFDRDAIADHKLYLTRAGLDAMARSNGLMIRQFQTMSAGMNQCCVLTRSDFPMEGD